MNFIFIQIILIWGETLKYIYYGSRKKEIQYWELERETRQAPEGRSSEFRQKKEENLLGWHLWSPQKKGLKSLYFESWFPKKRECFTLSSLNDENSCKNSFLSR